ncbi:MAG: hypothetical protein UZ17_ACD001000639 [Acidobacteria bacterium OLB17]|nr:MAG: hypothetical protein UZ17_ACD001000639 [Acidobacteria bacterium OLB17]MCZ2390568.1 DUF1800 domain-containing protein [Acidobacteriota bacterium]
MNRYIETAKKLTVMLVIAAFTAPAFALPGGPEKPKRSLTEDQKILHVLNRLGFGARPGDVERVRAMGIKKYIEQQLDPASIDDHIAEGKAGRLTVPNLTTDELFAKYPNPGALLRAVDGKNAQKQVAQNTPADGQEGAMPGAKAEEAAAALRKERQQELRELYAKYDLKPAGQIVPEIVANRLLRAVYSERQLQEVMVDFWQNHFNVFSGKAAVRWLIPSYERDVLRKNALGNFKDLLIGTAKSPAMLFYLDNYESMSPNSQLAIGRQQNRQPRSDRMPPRPRYDDLRRDGRLSPIRRERLERRLERDNARIDVPTPAVRPQQKQNANRRKRGINENYARELMELHTLGVDGGYTQQDIIEVAKCFTGWTIADPRGYRQIAAAEIKGNDDRRQARLQRLLGVPDGVKSGEFYFNPNWHEKGPKTVLGQKIDEGGINDGLKVIDILVNSEATAKFIAKKLAIKFVSDTPSDAFVGRIADAFHKSHGDIKTTLRAIFTDPEFYAPENYRAKIKSPFELAASSIRAVGGDTNGGRGMLAMLRKLGEVPYGYQAPTGYPDLAEDWVNTGALLLRLNFAVALASNRIPGTRVDLRPFAAADKKAMLDNAIDKILDGDIRPATKASLEKQLDQPLPEVKAPESDPEETADDAAQPKMPRGERRADLLPASGDPEVFKVVSLVLGSPEFQRQ